MKDALLQLSVYVFNVSRYTKVETESGEKGKESIKYGGS